jgi:hypothetical protein
MSDRLRTTGPEILYGLLGDYLADAELFERLRADILLIGTEVTTTMLKRASERGEARPDVNPRVAALPTDLYRNELLLRRTPPDNSAITAIVDEIFLPLVSQQPQTGVSAQQSRRAASREVRRGRTAQTNR